MEASTIWKRKYRGKGRWVKYWACLGSWISTSYGQFSLDAHFETYEPFISSIFQLFLDHSEPWITETADIYLTDTGAHLYLQRCEQSPIWFNTVYLSNFHCNTAAFKVLCHILKNTWFWETDITLLSKVNNEYKVMRVLQYSRSCLLQVFIIAKHLQIIKYQMSTVCPYVVTYCMP
jgi:hypothetical protein